MPLNLHNAGEYTPYLKFNAKSGRFIARYEGSKEDVDLKLPMQVAFDFAAIRTGWIKFPEIGPPVKKFDPSLAVVAICPEGEGFKRGFQVHVYIPTHKLALREWTSTAGAAIGPIMQMYEAWEQHGNFGEAPVYRCTGVEAVKGVHGTNYTPVFEFDKWTARDKVPGFDTTPTPRVSTPDKPDTVPPHTDADAPAMEDDMPF